jgi:hypothetical protein
MKYNEKQDECISDSLNTCVKREHIKEIHCIKYANKRFFPCLHDSEVSQKWNILGVEKNPSCLIEAFIWRGLLTQWYSLR